MRETRQRLRSRKDPGPKPVEKVELSEKHVKLRIVLVVLLALIGAASIGIGVASIFGKDPGWRDITSTSKEINCSDEFQFSYYLGAGEVSASTESRQLTLLYSDAVTKAYRLFTGDEEIDGVCNVCYINCHPNQEITVDPVLYQAFEQLERYGERSLYFAPAYVQYDDIFYCSDDSMAREFDPVFNESLREEFSAIARYAADPQAVRIELLGENRLRLHISEEYLAFAKENYIERFIDFLWMKNAFIADYLAEVMISNGYTRGVISSYDGFTRNLDDSGSPYSINLYYRADQSSGQGGANDLYPTSVLNYTGPVSMVYFRDYGINGLDIRRYYTYRDGTIRPPYLDLADGLPKAVMGNLVCYSRGEEGCADVLLSAATLYITQTFSEEKLLPLSQQGIQWVYCSRDTVYHSDPDVSFSDLYNSSEVQYRVELAEPHS